MSLIFSRSCQYAIQAVVHLSREGEGASRQVREISDALGIPRHFLGKVLQILNRDGILHSTRGTNGGFRLGRPASEIRLADIARSVDGPGSFDRCVLGFPECDEESPCSLHESWKGAKADITGMMNDTTIAALAGRNNSGRNGGRDSRVARSGARNAT